jgi:hypothetical protein
MKLTNGMKNYTYDKARDFAIKFCDKNFSIYEEDIVKSLISKNILTKFDLSTGLLNINKERYEETINFITENYSSIVVQFMEIILNHNSKWHSAYDLLKTLDDWIVVYQFFSFARLFNSLN